MAEIKGKVDISHGSSHFEGLGGKMSLKYQVYSDDRTVDDAMAVLQFQSIPPLGSPYKYNEILRPAYRSKGAKPRFLETFDERGAVWEVEVFYDNATGVSDNQAAPTESDPFSLNSTMERMRVVATHDLNGKRLTNSAGEPFPEIEREMLVPVISMTRQEYRNPLPNQLAYMDRVNWRPMWNQPVGQVYMRKIMPSVQVQDVRQYPVWTVNYEVAINLEGFGSQWELLDAGTMVLSKSAVSGGNRPVVMQEPIVDANGLAVTDPQLLNGNGQLLPKDEETGEYTADPVYLHYDQRYMADLRDLRLPNPFLV